jgi:hypothetical protein
MIFRIILLVIFSFFISSIAFCNYNEINIIIGDNVNVREKPDIKSKSICKLRLGDSIKIIKRTGKKEKIGDLEGEWIFVDTFQSSKGWIFSYYVACVDDFKRVRIFINCTIEGYIGDYYLYYKFNRDGTYITKRHVPHSSNLIERNGKLFQFKNVIFAKDDDGENYSVFYQTERKKICNSQRDLRGNPELCTICPEYI